MNNSTFFSTHNYSYYFSFFENKPFSIGLLDFRNIIVYLNPNKDEVNTREDILKSELHSSYKNMLL